MKINETQSTLDTHNRRVIVFEDSWKNRHTMPREGFNPEGLVKGKDGIYRRIKRRR